MSQARDLDYVGWKQRRAVAAALKPIYTAPTIEVARDALAEFDGASAMRRSYRHGDGPGIG